jgi:membrane protein DedA with SNARE-associated domain
MAAGEQFDIHVLVLIAAITSTAAKQIIFYASYGGRKIISEKTKKRMKPFQKLVKRYGGSAAFVAAATPIPDDLVYIPLGLAKYNPKRFFVATLSGKFVLYYVIALISHYMGLSLLEPVLQGIDDPLPVYIGIIALGAAMTIVVILLLRLNWERILGRVAPWTLEDDDNNNQN